MAAKIQLFGHSFVTRLKSFVANSPDLQYNFSLDSKPLVQYSGLPGATLESLRKNVDLVLDFQPDILILLIGTNDLFYPEITPQRFYCGIVDFIDSLLHIHQVPDVILCPILHRFPSSRQTKWSVDIKWFNDKVDETNSLLFDGLKDSRRVSIWRLKGFWSQSAQAGAFAEDGIHLSSKGQLKLYNNLRAAIVSSLNKTNK